MYYEPIIPSFKTLSLYHYGFTAASSLGWEAEKYTGESINKYFLLTNTEPVGTTVGMQLTSTFIKHMKENSEYFEHIIPNALPTFWDLDPRCSDYLQQPHHVHPTARISLQTFNMAKLYVIDYNEPYAPPYLLAVNAVIALELYCTCHILTLKHVIYFLLSQGAAFHTFAYSTPEQQQ